MMAFKFRILEAPKLQEFPGSPRRVPGGSERLPRDPRRGLRRAPPRVPEFDMFIIRT